MACELLVVACMWDLVPRTRIEPRPLHWERGVLSTAPPGKSHKFQNFKNSETELTTRVSDKGLWTKIREVLLRVLFSSLLCYPLVMQHNGKLC